MRRELPPDDAILCEKCGYILDHLPRESNCPECGKPVRDSIEGIDRTPPIVERVSFSFLNRLRTFFMILSRPFSYFRSLSIESNRVEQWFKIHMLVLSSVFFGVAGGIHVTWIMWFFGFQLTDESVIFVSLIGSIVIGVAVLIMSRLVIQLVAFLTTIEGKFWGYRLWPAVVRRVLCYHTAHLVPVSFLTLLIVSVNYYNAQWGIVTSFKPNFYLYLLCAWVLIASFWLMSTYVSAMRAVMFANRIPLVNPSQFSRDSASARPATVVS